LQYASNVRDVYDSTKEVECWLTESHQSLIVTNFLNATISTMHELIPVRSNIKKPQLIRDNFNASFGVQVGVLGDLEGRIVFTGDPVTFSSIGEKMYGFPLDEQMLRSFSGELANMIVGNVSTKLSEKNTTINISPPTILNDNTNFYDYTRGIDLTIEFESIGTVHTRFLID